MATYTDLEDMIVNQVKSNENQMFDGKIYHYTSITIFMKSLFLIVECKTDDDCRLPYPSCREQGEKKICQGIMITI